MAGLAYEVNATPGDRPLMSLLSSARPNGLGPECPEWPVNGPAMDPCRLQKPSASTSSVTELWSAGSMTTGSLAPTVATRARLLRAAEPADRESFPACVERSRLGLGVPRAVDHGDLVVRERRDDAAGRARR